MLKILRFFAPPPFGLKRLPIVNMNNDTLIKRILDDYIKYQTENLLIDNIQYYICVTENIMKYVEKDDEIYFRERLDIMQDTLFGMFYMVQSQILCDG